jgi:hypothetical protein
VYSDDTVEDLLVMPISTACEGMERTHITAEATAVVLVLRLVGRTSSFLTCSLDLFEHVAVGGDVIGRVTWAVVQDARLAQPGHRIKL